MRDNVNELRRMAYVQAMGIDTYVSRTQLPGAGRTQRLAIARRSPDALADVSVDAGPRDALSPDRAVLMPDLDPPVLATAPATAVAPGGQRPRQAASPTIRFSLALIRAGDWLWLESLGDNALATDQLALVAAMARALAPRGASGLERPEVVRFDWPMHNNKQLDIGEEAARSSLGAFLERRLRDASCTGLVLLGEEAGRWLAAESLPVPAVRTVATLDMLRDPALKRRAWRELSPLRQ